MGYSLRGSKYAISKDPASKYYIGVAPTEELWSRRAEGLSTHAQQNQHSKQERTLSRPKAGDVSRGRGGRGGVPEGSLDLQVKPTIASSVRERHSVDL